MFQSKSFDGKYERMGRVQKSTAKNRQRFHGESKMPGNYDASPQSFSLLIYIRYSPSIWRHRKRNAVAYDVPAQGRQGRYIL